MSLALLNGKYQARYRDKIVLAYDYIKINGKPLSSLTERDSIIQYNFDVFFEGVESSEWFKIFKVKGDRNQWLPELDIPQGVESILIPLRKWIEQNHV